MSLLILAGSSRKESLNGKLQKRIAEVAEQDGRACYVYPAAELDAPIYNGDYEDENGVPSNIQKLATAISDATKIVIVTPEYNSSVPPLLKNAIDWTTRLEQNPWVGKNVLLSGASPGRIGAMRSMTHLMVIMAAIKSYVAPMFLSCPQASDEAIANFDAEQIKGFLKQGD